MSSISTSNSGQKFIARNRAPRVQIDYDVEIYGSEKKIQIPFVMGVMADLSGKPTESLPDIGDRKFLDISVDNFDARMKSVKPRVSFTVPNTLTGEGSLAVDLTFESMDDFSPASIARRIGSLNTLLEARTQLHNLLSYMDGKQGAEELIAKVLKDPALLGSLAASAKPATPAEGSSAADKPAA
jgi:type VI secretion system protein ImpB